MEVAAMTTGTLQDVQRSSQTTTTDIPSYQHPSFYRLDGLTVASDSALMLKMCALQMLVLLLINVYFFTLSSFFHYKQAYCCSKNPF